MSLAYASVLVIAASALGAVAEMCVLCHVAMHRFKRSGLAFASFGARRCLQHG